MNNESIVQEFKETQASSMNDDMFGRPYVCPLCGGQHGHNTACQRSA